MQFKYDTYGNREQTIVYLATPSRIILCALNGIDYSSGNFEGKCNDVSTISFDVNQYVETYTGQLVESNAYNWLSKFMKLYVTGIGWFIMDSPTTHGTGTKEYKTVTAQSVQNEYAQIPLDGWKVNCGTTDSLEMLVDGNVEEIEGVEFAKEQIKFYNEKNHQLSLVNILVEKVPGWKVGYVDNIPKEYKTIENGEVITKSIYLKDEIGKFDLDYSDVYSFITQEFEKFFNCIVEFDFENLIVNFYRVENFGENTNITIGFRNVENSNEITIDEENIFTKIRVSGANDLGIEQCNGGSNYLFKLDKFWLNNKFLSDPTIEKYKRWEIFCVQARIDYTALSKEWNIQQDKISELYIRIPTGDCDPDKWDKLSDTELLTLKKDYEAQKLGYEKLYVDEEGNFDINALNASPDANIYHQIVDTILPNIQIEIDNRKLPTSEGEKDFIEEYLTNWKYYGINELEIKLKSYQDQAKLLAKSHYDLTWERYQELSKQDPEKYPALTEDGFKDKHNIYEKNAYQMDENNKDSCTAALKARRDEVKKEEEKQKEISKKRTALSQKMSLETWSDDTLGGFSKEELSELYHITKQTPYTNENIFTTNQDSLTDIVTTQSELCRVALEELQTYSIPQTIYSTSLDSLISASGMELHAETLDYGSFIWLGLRDDYYVKLRVMSISYNPFLFDNNFSLSFSNMIKSTSNRDDFMQILGSSSNLGGESSRNNVSGNLQLSDDNIYEILNKLLQSSAFNNKVQNIVNGSGGSIIGGTGGNYITPGTLEAEMIKCIDIHAENGFFQYLQAELISVGKIVAESGDFKKLQAKVGNIDDLLAGNVSAELGHIIKLTADNVIIDEAVIRQLIASQITVSMLKAGTINADKFNIESEDGGMTIAGNTMQFKDQNGVVRIQIGRDTNNNFTFCLYDETGKGVLIDSTGIKDSAISDGLIKNDMIANNTISKEKLSFQAVEQDADGKIHVSDVIVNGQGINASFTTIENSMSDMQTQIDGIKTSTPYTMNIFSSNGTIFRPGMINTTLTPSLYLGQSDITDMYDETHFVWTRQSADSDGDHYWNEAHTSGIKNLHITSDDVLGGASFTCSFFNDDGKLITEATF